MAVSGIDMTGWNATWRKIQPPSLVIALSSVLFQNQFKKSYCAIPSDLSDMPNY